MIDMIYSGRFGNLLMQDISISILSNKFNLKVNKYSGTDYGSLNVNLFDGIVENYNYLYITDDGYTYMDQKTNKMQMDKSVDKYLSLMELFDMDSINFGIRYEGFFQDPSFIKRNINEMRNHFKLEYNHIKDSVFVHVRLGDVKGYNPGYEYYKKCLDSIDFKVGYISSDSLQDPIVDRLCNEYGLQIYNNTEAETINFAKNFDNIILSQGTFSWWIGFLSKSNKIFWPKGGKKWHGDIFIFDEWTSIDFQ